MQPVALERGQDDAGAGGAVSWIGRLLPAGAGATALRDGAYFGGHGTGLPLLVLGAWTVLGLGLVGLAGRRAAKAAASHSAARPATHPATVVASSDSVVAVPSVGAATSR